MLKMANFIFCIFYHNYTVSKNIMSSLTTTGLIKPLDIPLPLHVYNQSCESLKSKSIASLTLHWPWKSSLNLIPNLLPHELYCPDIFRLPSNEERSSLSSTSVKNLSFFWKFLLFYVMWVGYCWERKRESGREESAWTAGKSGSCFRLPLFLPEFRLTQDRSLTKKFTSPTEVKLPWETELCVSNPEKIEETQIGRKSKLFCWPSYSDFSQVLIPLFFFLF